jgi:hypothetical protein
MFRLDDKHLEKAKEIALKNRKKKSCNKCYDRGYIGVTEENLLVICTKCVDIDKAMEDWKEYISDFPDLKEHFKELFEEENKENQGDK